MNTTVIFYTIPILERANFDNPPHVFCSLTEHHMNILPLAPALCAGFLWNKERDGDCCNRKRKQEKIGYLY